MIGQNEIIGIGDCQLRLKIWDSGSGSEIDYLKIRDFRSQMVSPYLGESKVPNYILENPPTHRIRSWLNADFFKEIKKQNFVISFQIYPHKRCQKKTGSRNFETKNVVLGCP